MQQGEMIKIFRVFKKVENSLSDSNLHLHLAQRLNQFGIFAIPFLIGTIAPWLKFRQENRVEYGDKSI